MRRMRPVPSGTRPHRNPLVITLLALCTMCPAPGRANNAAHRAPTEIVALSPARHILDPGAERSVNVDFGVAVHRHGASEWSALADRPVEVSVLVDHALVRRFTTTVAGDAWSLAGARGRGGLLSGRCARGSVHVDLPANSAARGMTLVLQVAGTDSTQAARRRIDWAFRAGDAVPAAARSAAPAAANLAAGCTETIVDDVDAWTGTAVGQALHPDGWPRLTYYASNDNGDFVLNYATQGPAGWTIETADPSGADMGDNSDLVIDAGGIASVSYWDYDTANLRYARRAAAGGWTQQTVASSQDVGEYNSIALDPTGLPRIAYSYTNSSTYVSQLRLASRSSGGVWSATEVVDNTADVGYYCSTAIDAAGRVHVAYYDWDNGTLKYAMRTGTTWTREVVDESGYDQGEYASLVLDAAGNPCIAYVDGAEGHLKFARKSGGAWAIQPVDASPNVGEFASLAIGGDGRVAIAYLDADNVTVKLARQLASGEWSTSTVTDPGSAAGPMRLRLAGGATRLAYMDARDESMRYLSCASTLDVPAAAGTSGASSLRAWPLPVRGGSVTIEFAARAGDDMPKSFRVLDVAGRVLRHLDAAEFDLATQRLAWDGNDAHGQRVRPGLYFVEARTRAGRTLGRITVLQ
jgi:hypothetical protein